MLRKQACSDGWDFWQRTKDARARNTDVLRKQACSDGWDMKRVGTCTNCEGDVSAVGENGHEEEGLSVVWAVATKGSSIDASDLKTRVQGMRCPLRIRDRVGGRREGHTLLERSCKE